MTKPQIMALLKSHLSKIAQVIGLSVTEKLKQLNPGELMALEQELHALAKARLRGEGPSEGAYEGALEDEEGPPSQMEGPPSSNEGAPFKFPSYLPFRLIRLAHSHPLWAKIEMELIRRDCAEAPLSLEEETSIILTLRNNDKTNDKTKGWTHK